MEVSTESTVLVLTSACDPTAHAVIIELEKLDARVVRLDIGDFPIHMSLAATISADLWSGRLRHGDVTVELADVRSIYYRRPSQFRLPEGMSREDGIFARAEARLAMGGVLAALDASWVNDPASVAVAEYKPTQLRVAVRSGLTIPNTYVGNDHAAAARFADSAQQGVVCKTLSPTVLGDEHGAPRITYTTAVDFDQVDPGAFAATAHQVQERVPKAYEVRVTMVGHQAFGVAIHATSARARVDWRSDYASLTYEVTDVPTVVAAGMRRYLDAFGLAYGAFDFIVTPSDKWVMLECNPAGQWLWLEEETGLPIATAFARLLAGKG